MTAPRVSVVIPTRNRLGELHRALASVAGQSMADHEVRVVVDGSTDGTAECLESGELGRICPGLHWEINASCVGAAAARNQAIRQCRGEFVAFLDDDDEWLPGYLQWQIAILDARPDVAMSCAPYIEFDADGAEFEPDLRPLHDYGEPLVHLLTESFVHTMSIVVCRRSVFDHVGLFDERWSVVHDWEWYARVLLEGGCILTPPGEAIVRREVPGELVTRHRAWYEEETAVLGGVAAKRPDLAAELRRSRAFRSLLLGKVSLDRRDYPYALRRIVTAFRLAPVRTMRTIGRRLARNRGKQNTMRAA